MSDDFEDSGFEEAEETPLKFETSVDEAKSWLARIEQRKTAFENGWWKRAKAAQEMYNLDAGKDPEKDNPFNILYANTEILLPSLFSSTPRPDVQMRGKHEKDPIARAVEAYLQAVLDDNTPGTQTFDHAMEQGVLGALVPGMGFVRVRAIPEDICPVRFESGNYDELIYGWARTWSKVPWIAFVKPMVREAIIKEFELSEEEAARLHVPEQQEADESQAPKSSSATTCNVYELWIRSSKQVLFLCDGYEDVLLREVLDDPMQLAGFFPTPGLLTLTEKAKSLDPTPIYDYYRNQAEELNRVTARLNAILKAIKVRGVYNPLIGDDVANILSDNEMENKLVAARTPMDLQGRGFEGHIWTLPIDKLISVARELYAARQEIIGVIYQITGLSDIVRGQTQASETARAQELKSQWGNVRLRRSQKRVSLYIRDLLRLAVDAGASTLSVEQWQQMTQVDLPTAQQMQLAQQQAAYAQQLGQPAPPPPQGPTWEEVLGLLQSDYSRAYSIDIETSSTIAEDVQAQREETQEFMMAFGQLMGGLAPLMQLGAPGAEIAKTVLLYVSEKYKLGRELYARMQAFDPAALAQQGQEKQAPEKPDHALEVAQISSQTAIQVAQINAQGRTAVAEISGKIDLLVEEMRQRTAVQDQQIKLVVAKMASLQKQQQLAAPPSRRPSQTKPS